MKHLNPYGTERKVEHVLLYLEKGQHQIVLRSYNRFEDNLEAYVRKSPASLCQTEIPLERENRSRTLGVRISSDDRQSAHTDCGLHNLVVRIL
jgi:alpha-L-fucosidase